MVQIKHQSNVPPTVPTDVTPVSLPVLNPEVEFELPDGRHIKMGRPSIPSQLLMPTLMSALDNSKNQMTPLQTEQFLIKPLLYVREIEHQSVNQVMAFADIQALGHKLGEVGIEAVQLVFFQHFPALDEKQLKFIKK